MASPPPHPTQKLCESSSVLITIVEVKITNDQKIALIRYFGFYWFNGFLNFIKTRYS